jgi:hypothetical protein
MAFIAKLVGGLIFCDGQPSFPASAEQTNIMGKNSAPLSYRIGLTA